MLHLLGNIPKQVIVACSGGPDSMAVLDFLRRSNRDVTAAYYDHGTGNTPLAMRLVKDYVAKHGLRFSWERCLEKADPSESRENFWRKNRYKFLIRIAQEKNQQVITCHHLDDQVEQYLFSTLNGSERLIPYISWKDVVIRPFLLNRKSAFIQWCDNKGVPYVVDPSNDDVSFTRNFIRHTLIPQALRVNPGLHKVVRKKVVKEFEENKTYR